MAKVTGPLLSLGGSGQIAKTQVYSKWRGISYVRQRVIPANPNTIPQQHTRGVQSWLQATWKLLDPAVQAIFTAYAKGKPLTDRNAFMKFNMTPLRGVGTVYAADCTGAVFSPGVAGGLAVPAVAAASGGAGLLTLTLTAPDLPAGWAIVDSIAVALLDKTVWNSADYTTHYSHDATAGYAPTFAGLAAGTYDVFGIFKYTKPDGSFAYSPSLGAQQAVA